MNLAHRLGAGQRQQVVAAPELRGPLGEAFAAVVGLGEAVLLDHRPEASVEQQDALGECAV